MNTSIRPLRFPQDILRFLYWVFFKPLTFDRYLHEIDASLPSYSTISLWDLWKRRKTHPRVLPIIQLAFFHLFVTPLLAFPIAYLFQLLGFEVSWFVVALGVAFGVVVGVVVGVAGGVAYGVALGVAVGVALGVAFGLGVEFSVAYGVAVGVAFGVAGGVAFGVTGSVAYGVALGVAFGVAFGVVEGVTEGVAEGVAYGVAYGVGIMLGYYRMFLYLFQAPFAWLQHRFWGGGLHRSPVFWDELIWLPLPGLDGLLVKIGKRDRQEGMQAIAYVAASFRQAWAAKRALLELTAYDLRSAKTLADISKMTKTLSWLPDDAQMDYQELLLGIEQASQHAQAALESETLYNQQEQLRMGVQVIDRIKGGFAYAQKSQLARQMGPALDSWKQVFITALSDANLKENIPNVYVSGSPLIKDSKSFKGRRDVFRSLTNELISPSEQRPTLLLFGARRMGKTSALKQLPVKLGPQIIPVSVDLQKAGTVENAAALLALVAKEFIKSARRERRLRLPNLDPEALAQDPYFAFQSWLEQIDQVLGDYYWVLLALDEFESLGEMLTAGRVGERIFQLLRGIIQQHPRITVLLSGAHTLEELPPLWSNYFINSKMLKVGPLKKADAVELITCPIEDFPLTYDDDALDLLLNETGLHPNWMQFTCREVVECLNEEDRFHATRGDVERAIARVPDVLAGDFKDLWEGRDSSDLMRSMLKDVAKAKTLKASKLENYQRDPHYQKTLDFIMRRDILIFEDDAYYFHAELLRRWVARQ